MWLEKGDRSILSYSSDQGVVVGDIAPHPSGWSAMLFGRSERGNFRRNRLFADKEEAKNWITKKVRQILELLGISEEQTMQKRIFIPGGVHLTLPRGRQLTTKSVLVVDAVRIRNSYVFNFRGTKAAVSVRYAEEIPLDDSDPTKASAVEHTLKFMELAGSWLGDGLRQMVLAYNRLSKAATPNKPYANTAKKAYLKVKLAMNLTDKAMDFLLDGIREMEKLRKGF